VSASVLYMSMSLDGYIAGPDDEPGNPGGDRFMRLHEWYGDFTPPAGRGPSGPAGEFLDEMRATGAVLAGRRTVEQVDHWGGDHHGVPISRCCSVPAAGCSRNCRRASSWRSCG